MTRPSVRDLKGEAASSIPVTVLTGYLGSGKTTLLNRLLAHPDMGETAVLVNEFGEVGLDHLLAREVDESTVLLNSGCLCCSLRGDLVDAMRDLFQKRVRGDVPEFTRMMVETTGLADPAPIVHTLMTDPLVGARYRLDGIVATVDSCLGAEQLDRHDEAVKQAAIADRIVLTKTDLADGADLERRLNALNPGAPVLRVVMGEAAPGDLLDSALFDGKRDAPDVDGWLRAHAYEDHHHHHHDNDDHHHHDDRVASFCLTVDAPIPWIGFSTWLQMMLATNGERVLRVKGILNLGGEENPVAVHGVQHIFHPPVPLPGWPDEDRRSRIVFITRDLAREGVEESFRAIVDAAR